MLALNGKLMKLNVVLLLMVLTLVINASPVLALDGSSGNPKNSHKNTYGTGWECNKEYRKTDNMCVAIKVPANAYPTHVSYGKGWKCNWGYDNTGQTCAVIKIPANAYLDSYGEKWKCDRGYVADNGACAAIKIPPNAYLNSNGNKWKCDRRYQQIDKACVAIQIPENAYFAENSYEKNGDVIGGIMKLKTNV